MDRLVNRTRISASIPRKLFRSGKWHLLPFYFFLWLSFLGREGIENSGSFKFADHIYVGKPRGYYGIGILIDALLLSLPSTRSFRKRYLYSRKSIIDFLLQERGDRDVNLVSVPSGIPREFIEAALVARERRPDVFSRTKFYCIDGDEKVLRAARIEVEKSNLKNFIFVLGDAFDRNFYPENVDLITSMGFGEFVPDDSLARFYNLCYDVLRSEGVFITAATVRHRFSDYLMSNIAELFVHYREEEVMKKLFSRTHFRNLSLSREAIGYQVFVRATKSESI